MPLLIQCTMSSLGHTCIDKKKMIILFFNVMGVKSLCHLLNSKPCNQDIDQTVWVSTIILGTYRTTCFDKIKITLLIFQGQGSKFKF